VSGRFSPLDAPLPLTRPSAPAPLRSAPLPLRFRLRSRSAPAPIPLRSRSAPAPPYFFKSRSRSAPAPLPLRSRSSGFRARFAPFFAPAPATLTCSLLSVTQPAQPRVLVTTRNQQQQQVCVTPVQCSYLLTYLLTYLIIKKYFSTARDFVYKY